jgi:hypothetical protein
MFLKLLYKSLAYCNALVGADKTGFETLLSCIYLGVWSRAKDRYQILRLGELADIDGLMDWTEESVELLCIIGALVK